MDKNPLGLKRRTHFLAREHIRRFADGQGRIHVYQKERQRVFSTHPDVWGLFNVDGVWSHKAENIMSRVEARFWRTLDSFQHARQPLDQEAVSEYMALWRARVEYAKTRDHFEVCLEGVTPMNLKGEVQSEDVQGRPVMATIEQVLERDGFGFYSNDIKASARSNSGAWIRWIMDWCRYRMREAHVRWGSVVVPDAVLVLPDRSTTFDIPITPHWFLHGFTGDEEYLPLSTAPAATATDFNRSFVDGAYDTVVASSPDALRR